MIIPVVNANKKTAGFVGYFEILQYSIVSDVFPIILSPL
jgi:hypothetical protein